ncbi:MAG TPA: hypothetical protein VG796_28175 [Verrucomicrobiales bacterium]|jgi:hypothetical protein|nr:hypothetical protein [Verrucomicrobiales bacterium]
MHPAVLKATERLKTTWCRGILVVLVSLSLVALWQVTVTFESGVLRGLVLLGWILLGLPLIIVFALANWLWLADVRKLRELPTHLHRINHTYRDVLARVFSPNSPPQTDDTLIEIERRVLEGLCWEIAEIYRGLINRRCTVTVKLVTEDDSEKAFCFTWARSYYDASRDSTLEKFAIDENTAFRTAAAVVQDRVSFFHSGDLVELEKRGLYTNQRKGWQKYYKSAIVVPIRYVIDEAQNRQQLLGFLALDTMETNRLNSSYHVELLAAFADQLYNFLSLMRHNYGITSHADSRAETHTPAVDETVSIQRP